MPGRIGINPPVGVLTELVSALEHSCAEIEHPLLVQLNVVNVEVEVDLLRMFLPGPDRRLVSVHPLEGERRPFETDHFNPVRLPRVHGHPAAEQLGIELSKTALGLRSPAPPPGVP